jgi:hypothetical protein
MLAVPQLPGFARREVGDRKSNRTRRSWRCPKPSSCKLRCTRHYPVVLAALTCSL